MSTPKKKKCREPICDNCARMKFVKDKHGETHRYCLSYDVWIPDIEMFPCCNQHSFR